MEWNGTEISVWNVEDARMEWNGRFQEWNGRQYSILPYQFHTRFRAMYLQQNTYRSEVELSRQGSRPRTDLLDAKARTKDTGASVLQKKEGLQKDFSSDLKKKGLQIFFSCKKGLQKFFSSDFYLWKTKKGLRKFSARFLALSNKISTV